MLPLMKTSARMASAVNNIVQARNSHLVPNFGGNYKNINFSGKLDEKVAVVTASSTGIGFGILEKMGFDGANLVVSSRNEQNIEQALRQLSFMRINALGVPCHVGNKEQREHLISETVAKFGKLDILVCNAAVNPTVGGLMICPEAAWDKIFDINVKSVWQMIKLAVPEMKKGKGGSIIIVSSIAGLVPFEMLSAYSISKAALLSMTKVLSKELAPDNIRVNCILPGIVKTKFSAAMFQSEEYVEEIMKEIPLKRVGTPQDMGNMVSFLASEEASYITGENFVVAGGMNSRL